MISVRVSEREFELLKIKAEAEGARCISDFARLVLCGSASGATERVTQGIHQLSDDVQQLTADVRRVAEILEAPRASARPAISLTTRKTRGA
jgi:outer membrane murein-binding lipoprotein Lpp